MDIKFLFGAAGLALVAGCGAADETKGAAPETEKTETGAQVQEASAEQPLYEPKIIMPEDRRSVPYPGHEVHVLAEMSDTEAGVYIQEEVVPPKSMGAPPHRHGDEDEYFIVLEGEITFLNGEESVSAGPGAVAILPRGHWHGFWNETDEPVRMLLAVAPGNFGGFFDQVVAQIREDNAATPEAIGGIIAAVAAARNVTVDMSRLPPEAAALLAPPSAP